MFVVAATPLHVSIVLSALNGTKNMAVATATRHAGSTGVSQLSGLLPKGHRHDPEDVHSEECLSPDMFGAIRAGATGKKKALCVFFRSQLTQGRMPDICAPSYCNFCVYEHHKLLSSIVDHEMPRQAAHNLAVVVAKHAFLRVIEEG